MPGIDGGLLVTGQASMVGEEELPSLALENFHG